MTRVLTAVEYAEQRLARVRAHEVVTVERGTTWDGRPGFAARCTSCGAITFGGAATRRAAAAMLDGEHTDAP